MSKDVIRPEYRNNHVHEMRIGGRYNIDEKFITGTILFSHRHNLIFYPEKRCNF
ncbi:MAG: hypothetical protein JRI38_02715 [Deltaproteobacteria bacterium]|nr:hypothetical protein [Deltaproteobacteria bacterium]